MKKKVLIGILISILITGILFFTGLFNKNIGGTFTISQLNFANVFDVKYGFEFETEYTTKTFIFTPVNGNLKINISQNSEFFGDIESTKLTACGNLIAINTAKYIDSNDNLKADISENDNNVVISRGKTIQIEWIIPNACTADVTLELKANQYKSLEVNHVRYPSKGEGNQIYKFHNSGSVIVDGSISEVDGVDNADFSPIFEFTTGHPIDKAYFYFNDDTDNVYLSADITGDNSNEFGVDWIELTIYDSNHNEQKTYRVSDNDLKYGKCGFGITSKVTYKHQICEIVIPKTENSENQIEFSIQYYGTASEDLTDPVVVIIEQPDTVTTDNTPTVRGNVTEDQSLITQVTWVLIEGESTYLMDCTADDGSFSSYYEEFTCDITTPYPLDSLPIGNYTGSIEVRSANTEINGFTVIEYIAPTATSTPVNTPTTLPTATSLPTATPTRRPRTATATPMPTFTSTILPTISIIVTDIIKPTYTIVPTISVIEIAVSDSDGNLLPNAVVTIDGQTYKSDDKGKIKLEKLPNKDANISIEYQNKFISGKIWGTNIEIPVLLKETTGSEGYLIPIICIVSTLAMIVFYIIWKKKRKSDQAE